MGVRVWFRVVVLGSALCGCGGAAPGNEPSTVARELSPPAALPAPAPSYPPVVRLSPDAAAVAAPVQASDADAPTVAIYDHGSGRSTASFSDAPAAPPAPAPATSAPPPAPAVSPAASAVPANRGNVANAARVVAAMRPDFRACYQDGLREDRSLAGSIRLVIRVGANGYVTEVSSTTTGRLLPSVVDCVVGRANQARFDPPEGGSAVIAVPVTFVLDPNAAQ